MKNEQVKLNIKNVGDSMPSVGEFELLSSNIASAVNQLYRSVKERKTKELVGLIKNGGIEDGTTK